MRGPELGPLVDLSTDLPPVSRGGNSAGCLGSLFLGHFDPKGMVLREVQ